MKDILLVSPRAKLAALVEKATAAFDVRLLAANSWADALAFLDRQVPDLVIFDLRQATPHERPAADRDARRLLDPIERRHSAVLFVTSRRARERLMDRFSPFSDRILFLEDSPRPSVFETTIRNMIQPEVQRRLHGIYRLVRQGRNIQLERAVRKMDSKVWAGATSSLADATRALAALRQSSSE